MSKLLVHTGTTELSSGTGVSKSVYFLATDWKAGVQFPAEAKYFSSSLCVQTSSEVHPASHATVTGDPFPGGTARLGRDADHSPPTSVEVKNE
jgi:hypothetical protein